MSELKNTRRFAWYDFAAIALGGAILLYFLFTAPYSVGEPDEAAYYILGHRVALGERLISDEWNLTQLGFLPTLPLYFLYTHFVGSSEGLVLAMRYVFLAADLAFYVYMYVKLRRYGLKGALASFFFCALFPQTFLGFSYCTISAAAVMAICLILFLSDNRINGPRLFLVGLLVAVAVMEDPFLLFLFLLWLVFVLLYALRRRAAKPFCAAYAFMLNGRAFVCLCAGIAVVFAGFMTFLLYNRAFEDLPAALPYLFSGSEYNLSNLLQLEKVKAAAVYAGPVFIIGLVLCLGAAIVICARKKYDPRVSAAVLLAACCMLAGSFVYAAVKTLRGVHFDDWAMFLQYHHFPLLLFSPVPFLLDPHRDAKRTAVLAVGLLYSVLMDIPSKSFLSIGGFIVRVPVLLQLWDLLRTLLRSPAGTFSLRPGAAVRAVKCGFALCLSVMLLWDLGYIAAEGVYKVPEKMFMHADQPLDRTLTSGGFKGLKTTASVERFYTQTLEDLDLIRQDPDCAVAVLESASFAYLYLDRPYAAYSSVYSGELERLSAYWKLPYTPDPDYVYVPYYNYFLFFRYSESTLQMLLSEALRYVEGDVIRGKAGYIIRVRSVL